MASQNDALIARRRAAMKAKTNTAPVVEEAEVPEQKASVQPLRPPGDVISHENGSPVEEAASVAVAAPTTVPRRSIALPQTNDDPTRSIGQGDLVMPKLKISQAMSKVNQDDIVRQGNYYHSTLNDNLGPRVLVIPVDMRKSRSRFLQGTGVLCRSYDMLQGEGDPGILCEGTEEERLTVPERHRGCPLRLWGPRDESGRSDPPECGIAYNYPLLILDPENPQDGPTRRALYTLRSTATKLARKINSIVTEGDYRWHEVVLELGLEKVTNGKGTFFVPTVEYKGQSKDLVSDEVVAKARNFATQVNAASIRATVEDDGEE